MRELARKQNLPKLSQLAARLASVMRSGSGDPFAEVKGLISDMVARLEDEAAADAKEKAFCDRNLQKRRKVAAADASACR